MFKLGCVRLLLLVVACCVCTAQAQQPLVSDNESMIYWAKPGFAPLYISSGASRNRGFGDLTLAAIGEFLPQYQHVDMRANYVRVMSELRRGSKICAILHKTPEREEFAYYSNPLLVIPSYQIYIHSTEKERFKSLSGWETGRVSFNDLLANHKPLRIAQTPSHSYGKARDSVIRRHQKNLMVVRSYAGQMSVIKMLVAKRVDLILEFPWVVNHHLEELKIKSSQLHKVVLTDVPSSEPAFIACPKTPWGQKLITELNQIDPPMHQLASRYVERWLSPAEVVEFRRANHEYFGDSWLQEK